MAAALAGVVAAWALAATTPKAARVTLRSGGCIGRAAGDHAVVVPLYAKVSFIFNIVSVVRLSLCLRHNGPLRAANPQGSGHWLPRLMTITATWGLAEDPSWPAPCICSCDAALSAQ